MEGSAWLAAGPGQTVGGQRQSVYAGGVDGK